MLTACGSPASSPDSARPAATQNTDALVRQINDNITLAPELTVSYQSIPSVATSVSEDPCGQKIMFSIRWLGKTIFRDTTDSCAYDPSSVDAAMRAVYPLWMPTGSGSGELLVVVNNQPSKDLARRFFIRDQRVIKIDTLCTFDSPARDVDGDGKWEYAGTQDYGEEWDDEQGRHRRAYNPTLYYEVRSTGLALDSSLTRYKARAQYGRFYGFTYSEKPLLLVK